MDNRYSPFLLPENRLTVRRHAVPLMITAEPPWLQRQRRTTTVRDVPPTPRVVLQAVNTVESTKTERSLQLSFNYNALF